MCTHQTFDVPKITLIILYSDSPLITELKYITFKFVHHQIMKLEKIFNVWNKGRLKYNERVYKPYRLV